MWPASQPVLHLGRVLVLSVRAAKGTLESTRKPHIGWAGLSVMRKAASPRAGLTGGGRMLPTTLAMGLSPGADEKTPLDMSLRRSSRRALLTSLQPAGTTQPDEKPHVSNISPASGLAYARTAEVASSDLGADGSHSSPGATLPATSVSRASSRTRKNMEPSASSRTKVAQVLKKSRILNSEVASPVTPSSLREEIGALRVGPVPRSLLDEEVMQAALDHLSKVDARLAAIIEQHTAPSHAGHEKMSPFKALVKSILYQQLAGKAAATIHGRLVDMLGGPDCVTPDHILAVNADQLRAVGISRQKASYLHDLSGHFCSGALSDEALLTLEDAQLMEKLTAVKGIGEWTAHMFMMFTLHRPDVLPTGDLAVKKGFQKIFGLSGPPTPQKMQELAEGWRPYRSVGSLYMWKLQDTVVPTHN